MENVGKEGFVEQNKDQSSNNWVTFEDTEFGDFTYQE
jgi:hypothetical protein